MARLEMRLLGEFDVALDGRDATSLESATAYALLARLITDPGRPMPRAMLAELLWPDRPAGRGLANLRHTLAALRRDIGDRNAAVPLLRVSTETLATDPTADVWVDALEFQRLAAIPSSEAGATAAWERAVSLRRGSFMDGFEPDISEEWDTWLVATRRRFDATAATLLHRLADLRMRTGEWDRSLAHARAWVDLDPWDERAHRLIIRALATMGQQAAALAHADGLSAAMADEFGQMEPSEAMLELIDAVRAGELRRPPANSVATPLTCVGRETEMQWLDDRLRESVGGRSGVVFVVGSAGSGKTTLLRAFANDARIRMPELTIITGAGNAYTGTGDPFLPFRQALALLCGDVDRATAEGVMAPADIEQLQHNLPMVVETVLDHGPHLLGTLIEPDALVRRFDEGFAGRDLGDRLRAVVVRMGERAPALASRRQPLIDECHRVLTEIAAHRPLVILIDDLQWADVGTLDMLQHLGHHSNMAPLLVIGALRPPEVESGHLDPLPMMIKEIEAGQSQPAVLELTGERGFVNAWLDRDPNLLTDQFRDRLFDATHGHALFTVEAVRAMKERGDLCLDDRRRWIEAPGIEWHHLPPRVETTIAARLSSLPTETRTDLEFASLTGHDFAAEVIAAARGVAEADVISRLSSLQSSSAALIEPLGVEQVGDTIVNRFRFRHALFSQFLEERQSESVRRQRHLAIARALERLHAGGLDEISIALARHFDAGGLPGEAIEHRVTAARRALQLSSTSEAAHHLERADELLSSLEPSELRDRRELTILTLLGSCRQTNAGYDAPETLAVYEQLRNLTTALGPTLESAQALGALLTVDGLRGDYRRAIESAERLIEIGLELGAGPVVAIGRLHRGWMSLMVGRIGDAEQWLGTVIDEYDSQWDDLLRQTAAIDVRSTALSWRSIALWYLGRFGEARRAGAEAIDIARAAKFPFARCFALSVAGCLLSELLEEPDPVLELADEVGTVASEEDLAFYVAAAQLHRGHGRALSGERRGFVDMQRGLQGWIELGTGAFQPWSRAWMAELRVRMGDLGEAAAILDDVERRMEGGEEDLAALRLSFVRGVWHRAAGRDREAEHAFQCSLAAATDAGAVAVELQTATALAELLCATGRPSEGRALLVPLMRRFGTQDDSVAVRAGAEALQRCMLE